MHRLLRICDFEKVEEVQEKEDFLDGFPSLKWQQVIAVIEANFETEPTYNLRTGPFLNQPTTYGLAPFLSRSQLFGPKFQSRSKPSGNAINSAPAPLGFQTTRPSFINLTTTPSVDPRNVFTRSPALKLLASHKLSTISIIDCRSSTPAI